jgi:hypothetical protein
VAKTVARRDVLRGGLAGAGVWLAGLRVDDLVEAMPSSSTRPFRAATKDRPASSDDLAYLTIAEAAELIRTRRLSPVEVVDACLSRIERLDETIQAWITVFPEKARAEAKAAAAEIARRGPALSYSRHSDRPQGPLRHERGSHDRGLAGPCRRSAR